MTNKNIKKKQSKDREILVSYVRDYRVKVSLTQKDVAKFIGITEQRFASIETNKHKTNIFKCLKIAQCLKTKVDNLYKIVKVTEEQYNIIKCINLEGEHSKELRESYDKLEQYNSGKSELTADEVNVLKEHIYKNGILRYGDVLESSHWQRVKELI